MVFCCECLVHFVFSPCPSHPPAPPPTSTASHSEVIEVVESLGEDVGGDQVRQVTHRLGFTRSKVTSLEQVVGGGERASAPSLAAGVAAAEAKRKGGGKEELAAALYEGGMPDAARKVDQRSECVCMCACLRACVRLHVMMIVRISMEIFLCGDISIKRKHFHLDCVQM